MNRLPLKIYSSNKYKLIQRINKSYIAELDHIHQQQKRNFMKYFPMLQKYANKPKIVRSLTQIHQIVSKPELSSENKLKVLDELKYLLLIPELPDEVMDVCEFYLQRYNLLLNESDDYEI